MKFGFNFGIIKSATERVWVNFLTSASSNFITSDGDTFQVKE